MGGGFGAAEVLAEVWGEASDFVIRVHGDGIVHVVGLGGPGYFFEFGIDGLNFAVCMEGDGFFDIDGAKVVALLVLLYGTNISD